MLTLHKKAALLALSLLTLLPTVSQADNLNAQPIYAKNNTNRPIWVAARYVPAGANSFVTDGWWQVNPNQSVLILHNGGRNIYFFARDGQGAVWSGNATSGLVRGETVNMFQRDTGTGFDAWTINFNSLVTASSSGVGYNPARE